MAGETQAPGKISRFPVRFPARETWRLRQRVDLRLHFSIFKSVEAVDRDEIVGLTHPNVWRAYHFRMGNEQYGAHDHLRMFHKNIHHSNAL